MPDELDKALDNLSVGLNALSVEMQSLQRTAHDYRDAMRALERSNRDRRAMDYITNAR